MLLSKLFPMLVDKLPNSLPSQLGNKLARLIYSSVAPPRLQPGYTKLLSGSGSLISAPTRADWGQPHTISN